MPRGEALARAIVGASPVKPRQFTVCVELREYVGKARGIIAFKIEGRVAPHFPIYVGIVRHQCAARECSLNRCESSGFVARSRRKNCRLAVKRAQLRFGLSSL